MSGATHNSSQQLISTRPRMVQQSEAAGSGDGVAGGDQCGEGFRDIRGVINCRGCGFKCESGIEFREHAREVERKKVRQEQSKMLGSKREPTKKVVNQVTGQRREVVLDTRRGVLEDTRGGVVEDTREGVVEDTRGGVVEDTRGGGKMEVVEHIVQRARMAEQLERTATHHSLVNTPVQTEQMTAYPGHTPHTVPAVHSMVTSVPQQLLQQQMHQQQLVFQQQQQLMLFKQQQQQAVPFPLLQQQLLPQQGVSDRDRHIALLEQELRVQKMMMEVERREAMLREQARVLTVQVDSIKMEQSQLIRTQMLPPSGISSRVLEQAWAEGGAGVQSNAVIIRAEGGGHVCEKDKLERMFQQMEKARKEELEKATVRKESIKCGDNVGEVANSAVGNKLLGIKKDRRREINCSEVTVGDEAYTDSTNGKHAGMANRYVEEGRTVQMWNKIDDKYNAKMFENVSNVDDVDNDSAKEQLKILEDIKLRNEKKRKQEEMSIKLISELSLAEGEQLLPDSCNDATAAVDSWPDLKKDGAAGGVDHVEEGGETVRQKIARLKETAEKRGMSLNALVERRGRHNGLIGSKECTGLIVEDAFRISSQNRIEENGKRGKKELKKAEKLIRERKKCEAMTELEMERNRAADDLKERLAAQEREQFSKMVSTDARRGEKGKQRNKSGK